VVDVEPVVAGALVAGALFTAELGVVAPLDPGTVVVVIGVLGLVVCGPRTKTMTPVKRITAAAVATAVTTSRRGRGGR
jgi:hypothetical protein